MGGGESLRSDYIPRSTIDNIPRTPGITKQTPANQTVAPGSSSFTQQDPLGGNPTARATTPTATANIYVGCNPVNGMDPGGATYKT